MAIREVSPGEFIETPEVENIGQNPAAEGTSVESSTQAQLFEVPELPAADAIEPAASPHRVRRAAGRLAGVSLAAFLGGSVAGSIATPAHVPLGASEADMKVTLDTHRSVDFGVPGELSWPQRLGGLPFGPGIRFEIKGIPIEDGHGKSKASISQADIQRYENFLSDQSKIEHAVIRAVERHAVSWGLGSMAAVDMAILGLYLGARGVFDKKVRQGMAENIHAHRMGLRATAAAGTLCLVAVGVGASLHSTAHAEDNSVRVSSEFDGTPLENARIKGKMLSDGINNFGVEAVRFLDNNEKFYDAATKNLTTVFKQTPVILKADSQTETLLFETGLHCNVGMMKVLGKATELFKPTLVLDGGDTTFSGSSLEAACIRTLRDYIKHAPIVTSPGDHDSTDTMQQEQKSNITVLNGHPAIVAGLKIRGDADPRHASFLQKVKPRPGRHETVTQMGEREAAQALAAGQTDDVDLNNEPGANRQLVVDGSAPLALDGGYARNVEIVTGTNGHQVVHYTGMSAGGATEQRMTIGPLQDAPAEFVVFQIDKATHKPLAYQVISVQPDTSVGIETPVILPAFDEQLKSIGYFHNRLPGQAK